jgi:hypothetical protein
MRLLLFIVLLVAALVAQAPAWLVARPIRDVSNGIADLANVSGTAWRGSADLVLKATLPVAREIAAGRVEWSVRRVDLLARAATIELRQPASPPQTPVAPMTVAVGPGDRLDIAGSIRVPVQAIALVPLLNGWTASGDAVADIPRMQRIDGVPNGSATIRWNGARIEPPNLPGGLGLGNATGTATVAGGATTLNVRSTGGDVDVAVDGASRSRTIAVTLQPRPSATPAQLAWLQSHTMGRTSSGGYRIDAGWP